MPTLKIRDVQLEIEPDKQTPPLLSSCSRSIIEGLVSWKDKHKASAYLRPGRSQYIGLICIGERFQIVKIKGAGCYNPPNVSSSGLRRTIKPIPEHTLPVPPLTERFERDIIHVDPSTEAPHLMCSVPSTYAPVGGMTLKLARNDQEIFKRLRKANIPSNEPLGVYRYTELEMEGHPMAVSLSRTPNSALQITPYDLYLWTSPWQGHDLDIETQGFLGEYIGDESFCINVTDKRLRLLMELAMKAGALIADFSLCAGLYRFSGSPDNFSMRSDTEDPLFFSDVDTADLLENIAPAQRGWEVIRNILSAIHQWVYYSLPPLTHPETEWNLEDFRKYDFVSGLLLGFFKGVPKSHVILAADKVWKMVEDVLPNIQNATRISLRGGESILETQWSRPEFYFELFGALIPLIEASVYPDYFPESNLTRSNINEYVKRSRRHKSHAMYFSA